jgi:hypothetical protein
VIAVNTIDPVKGRDPFTGDEVACYLNLLNRRWSVTAVKAACNAIP